MQRATILTAKMRDEFAIPLDTRQFMTILELGDTDEGYVID